MKNSFVPLCFYFLLLCLISCVNTSSDTTSQNKPVAATEVKSVFIRGDSIHYIDIGTGDPVVLIHGSLGDYRTWAAQMDTFAKSYRVIAYSRRYAYPNNQVIDDSADYSVTAHAKDLAQFLQKLGLKKVHLVGHSFGAFTALLTAMEHPELVRSITLGEPPVMSLLQKVPGGDTLLNNFVTKTIIPVAEAFKINELEKAIHIFISGVMNDSLYFDRLQYRDRDLMMMNTLETRGMVSTQNVFPQVTCDELKKVKSPVLLLKGDKSPKDLISIITELGVCLGNKEVATLLNTSHGLPYESPDQFNKVVLNFIDRH